MRKAMQSVVLFLLGALGAVLLGAAMAITAAVSLAATALIVPGTGTPVADLPYMENVRDYYLGDTACQPGSCTLESIEYPASFWPMPFPGWCRSGANGCDTWNVSVEKGVEDLDMKIDTWLAQNPDNDERLVIFGYSQGGQVVSNKMRELATTLTPQQKERIEVVMIGSIANPDGGLWPRLSPFSLLTQVLLDATLGPPMITDSGLKTTVIGFEYDPVVYSPKYWGNPLAVLNALAAFDTVHGQYLAGPNRPGSGSLPYGYTQAELEAALADPANVRYGGGDPISGNRYIMIPAKSLPLADLILNLADSAGIRPFVKPFVDLLAPMAKVIIDLGYDWSGDPDTPQSLSILPFNPNQNWLEVGVKLIAAAIQGIEAFLGNFGVDATADPATPQEPLSTLRMAPAPTDVETVPTEETPAPEDAFGKLRLVPDLAEAPKGAPIPVPQVVDQVSVVSDVVQAEIVAEKPAVQLVPDAPASQPVAVAEKTITPQAPPGEQVVVKDDVTPEGGDKKDSTPGGGETKDVTPGGGEKKDVTPEDGEKKNVAPVDGDKKDGEKDGDKKDASTGDEDKKDAGRKDDKAAA